MNLAVRLYDTAYSAIAFSHALASFAIKRAFDIVFESALALTSQHFDFW